MGMKVIAPLPIGEGYGGASIARDGGRGWVRWIFLFFT